MVAHVVGKKPLGAMSRAGVVIGMHAVALFVIAQGLGIKFIPTTAPPEDMETTIITEKPDIEPVAPVVPREHVPEIYVPTPEVPPIETQADPPPHAEVLPQVGPVQPPSGSAEVVPRIEGVRQLARGLTQPPYPPARIRQGIEGAAVLEVYVLPTGRVGEARVVTSTGYEDMDRSAMDEAKRNWRFAPATRDGVPMAQWYRLRVVFKLQNVR